MTKTERFFVLLMLLMVVSVGVNAQTTTPDCKQFTYSEMFHSCVAEFVFPRVQISHVEGKFNEGYNAHFVFSNNTTGTIVIQDVQFINTAPDGTVQRRGTVIILDNGQRTSVGALGSTLSSGNSGSFDIVDTNCQYTSNLCTIPPPEMDVSVKVTVGGDPLVLSSLIMPTINIKDTINGK